MTAVAASIVLHQAVAEISAGAFASLRGVQSGEIEHARVHADAACISSRGFARMTGATLADLPGYKRDMTDWRAIARLAGATIDMRSQAG